MKDEKDKIDHIVGIASYVVLLLGSLTLGLLGKPKEMGLVIIAGAIGLSFANLSKIKRFKGAGFEAETWEQMKAVIEKETESPTIKSEKFEAFIADENARKVIKALKNPKYTWRYVSGIVKETGLSKNEVEEALDWLVKNQLAMKSIGLSGSIWSLTVKGRNVFQGT